MKTQLILENKRLIIAVILAILGLILVFFEPSWFSAGTGVPYWFLSLKPPLSITSEKRLKVEVNPNVNVTLGDFVTVKVTDAQNNTSIGGALVELSKDGINSFKNITTQSNGIAVFEYTEEPTFIFVSKEGYSDADPVVIPKIPDWWVTVINCQYAVMVATLLANWVPAFYIYKQWSEERWWKELRNKTELELIRELGKISSEKYKTSKRYWRKREKLGISSEMVLNSKKEAKRRAIMELLKEVYGWK
jgi:hypothetical protein